MRPRVVDLGPETAPCELDDDAASVAIDYPPVHLPAQAEAGPVDDGGEAAGEWARVCARLTTASDWAD